MKRLVLFIAFSIPLLLSAQKVISIKIDGAINPVVAGFIHRTINRPGSEHAGLYSHPSQYTRRPVEFYPDHRGRSAGITHSGYCVCFTGRSPCRICRRFYYPGGHIAAMAPGTNIGAAHPVTLQGTTDSVMNSKSTNDAAAFIRTIAEFRKRNLEWSEDAVRQSVAITDSEALQKKIIDLIAMNDQDLLERIDGKWILRDSIRFQIHTRGAGIQILEMGFTEKVLNIISDPDVAYILLMLGLLGLLFELFNPGIIFPGIIGFISLTLAFYALNTLPLNYAGLALIVFGVVLLLLEIKIISHGMLAIGGIAALLIGSFMLIRPGPGIDFMRISRVLIISTVG